MYQISKIVNSADFLIILSAFCWAIYTILGRKLLEKYDPFTLTTYVFVIGTLLFLPFVYNKIDINFSWKEIIIILYLALLCSVLAYVGWYKAISKIGASSAAIYLNLIPLFAMFLSYFILNERLTLFIIVGSLLIIYGIYLAER